MAEMRGTEDNGESADDGAPDDGASEESGGAEACGKPDEKGGELPEKE